MTKAVFAGKKEKKFSFQYGFVMKASINTVFSWLSKLFLMSKCP